MVASRKAGTLQRWSIPITFEFEGREYRGELVEVTAGGSYWQLLIDRYFYGDLMYSAKGWAFYSPKDRFPGMADYFGDYLTAYLQ
ncbi:MAG: hypothetical protein EOP56_19640 [Sphingobacteriales bacterium]|nr:MAG: hypothetical protein EOP56_19640 [Sphingobacteriales bacterium]